MKRVAIAGIGHTAFGRLEGRSALELEAQAARRAVDDAGFAPQDIDGLITDPGVSQGVLQGIEPHYLRLGRALGLDPDFAGTEILGGASSAGSIQRAAMAIDAGLCSTCLCVYGDTALSSAGSYAYGRGAEAAFGFFGAAGLHALAAQRHMALHGTRPEALAEVAIAARAHAARTPHAQLKTPLDIAGYFASRMLVEPLRRADCCLVSDGAAAVVVCAADRMPDTRRRPVRILGMGQAHSLGTYSNPTHFDALPAARCGPRALERAGLAAADVDVAMLYDCFTIVVLMQLEAYGFCAPGEAGDFVAGGRIAPGGALPVNPSGGLLAEGYGGGMLHVIEAVRQLRGDAGERQVANAEVALVTGHGLGMNSHATLILGR
ncbi:MAG: thiolase family protein [Burkholderiaceae bacterium]|nr:thiolase family protein [Burkholderiaceae bacterium]MEB2351651.1 thiolase family protein [Burkholderiaceae bacterium]